MPIVRVTRRVHFCSAHRLFRKEWTDQKNEQVFGHCSNPNWHGHNYDLDVEVVGEIDPETGFLIELGDLKRLIGDRVIQDLDHKNLNLDVPWMSGLNPTTENLAVAIWKRLEGVLPGGVNLDRIVLWETPRNRVEYSGG